MDKKTFRKTLNHHYSGFSHKSEIDEVNIYIQRGKTGLIPYIETRERIRFCAKWNVLQRKPNITNSMFLALEVKY